MKKFLIRFFQFVFFSGFFYVFSLVILGHYHPPGAKDNIKYVLGSYGHTYTRLQEVRSYGNVDILFLGSSHAYRGFDTRIYRQAGIQSFNLGSSGQTPIQTEILINRYFHRLSPKLVVYEVYPWSFSSDGVESALDLIANDEIDFQTVKMALMLNHITVYNTLIFGFFRDCFHMDRGFVEKRMKGDDIYWRGGFVEKRLFFFQKCDNCKPKTWSPEPYQIAAFKRILGFLKQKDVEVILVQAPVTLEMYQSFINKSEIEKFFSSLNLPYYNFNKILKLRSDRYFYDSHHLNQLGVVLFNNQLLSLLKKRDEKVIR